MFEALAQAAPEVAAVVVEAPRLPPLPGEVVYAAAEIPALALAAEPRLDEVLRREPGVSLFRRTGSDAANPTIQGVSLRAIAPSGAGRALVTLDGVPQNDPFGGWVIWSSLPPEGLAGGRIVRGAGAGPYGAGALTGVVALRERDATGGLAVLDLSAGERDSWRAAAAFGPPGLLLTAAASATDGYAPVRGAGRGAADIPTTLEDLSVAGRLQAELGGAQAALRLAAYQERRGSGLPFANSRSRGASAALTVAQAPEIGRGGWRLQGWLRSSDLRNTSAAVAADRNATTPANEQYATPALGWGFNGAWQAYAEAWSYELGLDARFAEGRSKERFRNLGGGFTRGREAGGQTAVYGAYAEAARTGEDLVLTAGLRLDGWRAIEGVRLERDLATGQVLLDAPTSDRSGTTPTARLGARWRLTPEVWLRGAAYSGFRPPTLNELHRPFRVGNDITEANGGLEPERLYGAEAGLVGEGAIGWSATLFHNRLVDPITNVTIGQGPGTFPVAGFVPADGVLRQRRNAGEIKATGVEFDVQASPAPGLDLRFAAAATDAEVDGGADAPQLTGLRPAQTATVTATAGAVWAANERLTLQADLRYEGERFEDDLNTRTLSPALGVDARVAWRVRADAEAYLAVENLFDAEIEVAETGGGVESYAAPRTLRIGFALRR